MWAPFLPFGDLRDPGRGHLGPRSCLTKDARLSVCPETYTVRWCGAHPGALFAVARRRTGRAGDAPGRPSAALLRYDAWRAGGQAATTPTPTPAPAPLRPPRYDNNNSGPTHPPASEPPPVVSPLSAQCNERCALLRTAAGWLLLLSRATVERKRPRAWSGLVGPRRATFGHGVRRGFLCALRCPAPACARSVSAQPACKRCLQVGGRPDTDGDGGRTASQAPRRAGVCKARRGGC